jgi:hypothetical protein
MTQPEDLCPNLLVGDGAAHLRARLGPIFVQKHFQLTGINNISDLYSDNAEVNDEPVDDLVSFDFPEIGQSADQFEEIYLATKRSIFEKYNYLNKLSQKFAGRLVKEKDLILSDEDKYLIEHFKRSESVDSCMVNSIAQLSAYYELGFTEAKFVQQDCCPMCSAYDGCCYDISQIIDQFRASKVFIHKNCECRFVPIIRDRSKVKDLEIDIPLLCVGDVFFKNVPLEFKEDISELANMISYEKVEFVDFSKVENGVWEDGKDHSFVVVDFGKLLIVHNGYLENLSPYDFLFNWVAQVDSPSIDISAQLESCEIYYLNGRKVVEVDGNYVDIETKEIVK